MHRSFSPDLRFKTLAILLVLAMTLRLICAQEHLEPWPKSLSGDQYYAKIREILGEAYRSDVVLRIIIAPSFQPEEIAGIRKTGTKGYEVFDVKPTTMIWDTLSLREYESGRWPVNDKDGKPFAPATNPIVQSLKKANVPSEYRQIKVQTHAVPIPADASERVIKVWKKMLADAREPKQRRIGADGETYRFDLLQPQMNSAGIWSPEEHSRTAAMVKLGIVLAEYARGQSNQEKLASTIKELE
jgi:hypothetical protein